MKDKRCSVESCEKKHEAKGYCNKHYIKWKTWGTPTPSRELKEARRAANLPTCDYCDEKATTVKSGLCKFHRQRKERGLPLDQPRKIYRLGSPGYMATHDKMRKEIGRASAHLCVDCGTQAHHWSLKHNADIIVEDQGAHKGRKFSRNTDDYEPRCVPCHVEHDNRHGLIKNA